MAKIRINGDTSGYIEISAPAVAGSTSITLPATTGGSLLATDANGNLNVDSGVLYVDGVNNRVGISTTSPAAPLDVAGGWLQTAQSFGISLGTWGPAGSSSNNSYLKSNSTIVELSGTDSLLFRTNAGTERARIDSAGRLLVGTSSARTAAIGGSNQVVFEAAANYFNTIFASNNNTPDSSFLSFIKSRGTTSGSHTIVANGDDLGVIDFEGADGSVARSAARITAQVDGTPGSGDMPGRLVFSTTADGATSPTEHFRVSQNGIFRFTTNGSYTNSNGTYNEIYQTNPSVSLYVRNTHGSNPYGFQVYYDTAVNNTGSEFLYCGDSAQRATIRSNGGLANFQANNVNLSDINTKKDISPAAGTWDCIKEWEIVNYRYKDQPDDADLNLGVIAQQVAESCPEVITVFEEAKDDQPEKLGVKEQQMYWMAIKALQEAQLRIEQLEATNASFEARLSALEVKP